MRNNLAILAVLSLGACSKPAMPFGLWVFEFGELEFTGTTDCDENFSEAECPEGDEPVESDWEITEDYEQSPGLTMVEVLRGEEDAAFLAFDGEIFPGTLADDAFTFSFTNFVRGERTEDYDGDYEFRRFQDVTVKTTITLSFDDKAGTGSGKLKRDITSTQTVEETDDPGNEDVMFTIGQINNIAQQYLVNTADEEDPDGRQNTFDEEECDSSVCEITIEQNEVGETALKATYATDQSIGNIGMFEEYGQEPGVPTIE